MIGVIAAFLTTFSFVPQVIKVLKSKDASAISLGMYSMSVIGIFLWMVHGIRIGDMALIAANAVTFVLASIILICKLKYK
ncbi:SemiSWEET transporter [Clostridium sp. SHJSY1]|uniref:SemiSWEET transporter n=1 Tax=Clostridium sp. SHJSY1 TaxID=2942483 RepID=UPI0028756576|nr:SemiSWEET transporter [Clostridium sp. SHJSY1]MDS0527034.1 SemiSWEET transporter [Clostridium sp. SHJSY1]